MLPVAILGPSAAQVACLATILPVESPWVWIVGAVGMAGLAFLVWAQSGDARFLGVAVLAGLVGGGAAVVDRIVVTDRERIEELFPSLAAAAEAGDVGTVLAAFDPESAAPRELAEKLLRQFDAEEVRVTSMEVEIPGTSAAGRARASFLVRTRGTLGGATPVNALIDFDVDLRKVEGEWRVSDFEIPEGRRIDRR